MAGFGKKEKSERIKLEKGAYKRAFRVFKYIKPYRGTFFVGMLFLVLSSVATMGFPYYLGKLLGSTKKTTELPNKPFDLFDITHIDHIVIALFLVFLANAIFSFFRIYLFTSASEKALRDIRATAFKKLLFSDITFFDKSKVGELSSRIATDLNNLQELLVTLLAEFIRQWITIIISVIVIGLISTKLLLIMLSAVPVVIVMIIIFGKYIKKLSKKAQDASAKSNDVLSESLSGIKNIKSFANEYFEIDKYGIHIESIKNLSIKGAIARGLFAAFIIIGLFGTVTLVIWQGIKMVQSGDMNETEFGQFIMFTIFLGASFGSIGSLMGSIQKAIGATERLMDILNKDTEVISTNKEYPALKNGSVVFNNVNFHYETRQDVQVLSDVSFTVNEGETTAIVGPSGAGKSTITSLILKFYDLTTGTINIGNKDINAFDLKELRSNMAIVPQDVVLFGGTIAENIAYGKIGASETEIIEAAKQANAWEFVSNFPDGLKTLVGDRGIQLSGGQKQRIAIARALLKNPKILILDEATSSLDSESEKLVQDALDNLMQNRTSIVIAHRLSTIKNADNILVLEKGKIVESGKHSELVNNDGVYAKLSAIQFGSN